MHFCVSQINKSAETREAICRVDIAKYFDEIPYSRDVGGQPLCEDKKVDLESNESVAKPLMGCGLKINDQQYFFFGRGEQYFDVYLYICTVDEGCTPIRNIPSVIPYYGM